MVLGFDRDRMFDYGVLNDNVFRIFYYELCFVGYIKL